MPNIGPLEIAIVVIVAVLIFGPRKLPELGRSMGAGMREFKDGITGKQAPDDSPEAALEPGPAAPLAGDDDGPRAG